MCHGMLHSVFFIFRCLVPQTFSRPLPPVFACSMGQQHLPKLAFMTCLRIALVTIARATQASLMSALAV